ncbi:DUF853 family protein [Bacteroides sp. OttesenSCG-928-D19]|nr:DUF853 family protein [Bacteroides sp. OttesenSCG-928-N06]MDL2304277.1 DUF853 family protein [Bacteroides sp. OttesenSCG-928-D19]
MANRATHIGEVQNVDGTTVSVSLSSDCISGLTYVDGEGYRIGQVGSFVKIPLGYNDLFGIVSQIGANAVPEKQLEIQPYGNRWMTIQLIGEGQGNGGFERGISQYPTIGDEVHLVSESDLKHIYGHINKPYLVNVGHIAGSESIPALIDINKLITRHSAIVGSTGSGKSTTVAGIIDALANKKKYPSSRILIFDIHGEYSKTFKNIANIYKINPESNEQEPKSKPLHIPYWAMSFDELISLTLGDIDEKDKAQIGEMVLELKKKAYSLAPDKYVGLDEERITSDTPLPFSLKRLWLHLYRLVYSTHSAQSSGQKMCSITDDFDISKTTEAFQVDAQNNPIQTGNYESLTLPKYKPQQNQAIYLSSSTLNIRRPVEHLTSKLRDPRFDFIFNPGNFKADGNGGINSDLDILFHEWIGEKNITVLDLSGVPNNILNTIIGVLLRIIYDAIFWSRRLSQGGKNRPLLLVMEEAHNYLNDNFKGIASSIVQRIVKEGRKYGIGAMIVSQRPSEINSTILSQCGTIVSLRLSNSTDRGHVTGTVTDNLDGLMSMLPILRTGEAIIVGESVKLPMRALINPPEKERRPDSQDPIVVSENTAGKIGWQNSDKIDDEDYKKVIQSWRTQNPSV